MATFSMGLTVFPPTPQTLSPTPIPTPSVCFASRVVNLPGRSVSAAWRCSRPSAAAAVRAAVDGEYSTKRSSSSEQRETIMLPGCDYNHWLIVMEFPKDPAPTREQMIDTYLNMLATVLGSMEEAKKNMYAFSTTTYTGFQCTVDEATSEKFKGLPGVLWVLPDSYIDVKNKDYGGDKYINGREMDRHVKDQNQGRRRVLRMQIHHPLEVEILGSLGLFPKQGLYYIQVAINCLCYKDP
ncbi:hypothetical protein MLD38_010001 [Melastoma candidum]|uniref:Uncharacterized protein n=1 Tax=Melastoma candidum TaxID=119954 RepID=A0ACB9QYZ8_9MYRT|nr:hypothetical protein MLD38_010001 [Melastoma candidum]